MVRFFEIVDSSTGYIRFKAKEFDNERNLCFVVYDTPTQYQLSELTSTGLSPTTPDYYVWRSLTSTSTGLDYNYLDINNDTLFTVKRNKPQINYDDLYDTNLHIMTSQEFDCLRQLVLQLDLVHRRYPFKFQKKFTIEELLVFLEAALVDVNITPPVTRFWWYFEQEKDGQYQYNPMSQFGSISWQVPKAFKTMIVYGALIHALIARGILEVDVHFTYNDQGINLTYDNVSHYSRWWTDLVGHYVKMKEQMKRNYAPKGRGLGSIPDFGIGWFGLLNSALDNRYTQIFYPFWLAGGYSGGRAQL